MRFGGVRFIRNGRRDLRPQLPAKTGMARGLLDGDQRQQMLPVEWHRDATSTKRFKGAGADDQLAGEFRLGETLIPQQ